jgi:hypothetical protein
MGAIGPAGAVPPAAYRAGPGPYGPNPDHRASYYSTRAGYPAYSPQSQAMQQTYPPAPAPHPYNTAGLGAGAAAATAVGGGVVAMAYNTNNNHAAAPPPPPAPAPPPAMPNPFDVSAVDVAPPVPVQPPGQQILVVKRTFTPNLLDELSITTGESVSVLATYDDGWCKVRKLGAGAEEGVVPMECLEGPGAGVQGELDAAQDAQSRRASSTIGVPRT